MYSASIPWIIKFLQRLLDKGKIKYGSFNAHSSALALILGEKVTSDLRLRRFLKGVFRLRPPKRRYNFIWEPKVLLDYLESLGENRNLSLMDLSIKTASLLALITAHRLQTLV